jgi:hypothetical protein
MSGFSLLVLQIIHLFMFPSDNIAFHNSSRLGKAHWLKALLL